MYLSNNEKLTINNENLFQQNTCKTNLRYNLRKTLLVPELMYNILKTLHEMESNIYLQIK